MCRIRMLKQYCGTTFKPELWIRIRHFKWIRIFLWSKIAIYLSVGLSQLQEKTSVLKREHPVLKILNSLIFYFWRSFLPSWIGIRIQEHHWLPIRIRIRIHSTYLNQCGSATLAATHLWMRIHLLPCRKLIVPIGRSSQILPAWSSCRQSKKTQSLWCGPGSAFETLRIRNTGCNAYDPLPCLKLIVPIGRSSQILPAWSSCWQSKKTQSLWWRGLPPPVRGRVWKLALHNQVP